jgi:hypothetical protein
VRNCVGDWVPEFVSIPLGGALSRTAELTAVGLGDTAWVTIPGELQSALGEGIRQAVARRWRRVFVAGVSNDYLGYFLTAEDYGRASYVACSSLYGPEAGPRLARTASRLLRQLAAATP